MGKTLIVLTIAAIMTGCTDPEPAATQRDHCEFAADAMCDRLEACDYPTWPDCRSYYAGWCCEQTTGGTCNDRSTWSEPDVEACMADIGEQACGAELGSAACSALPLP